MLSPSITEEVSSSAEAHLDCVFHLPRLSKETDLLTVKMEDSQGFYCIIGILVVNLFSLYYFERPFGHTPP